MAKKPKTSRQYDDEIIEIGLYRKALVKVLRLLNLGKTAEAKKEIVRILDLYDPHYKDRNSEAGKMPRLPR